jgi:hypothetical protein
MPAEIRRKRGVGLGSVLEGDDEIVAHRAGGFSSTDIHLALFSVKPLRPQKNAGDLKQGIREYIRKRHAGH